MISIEIQKQLHGSKGIMCLDINLHIAQGEFVALMGESGAGKTTLLRVLAGLEDAKGSIFVDGISWHGLAVQKREIGFVFQEYALFENMTVEENLLFVQNDTALSMELLEITDLLLLRDRHVTGLSGGQKQRVALCRAMMKKPKLLLLDEPLSALSVTMRSKLQSEIKALHYRFGTTTIMVSHSLSEVFSLASRVLVLEQGNIIKDGTASEVLRPNGKHSVEVLDVKKDLYKSVAAVSFCDMLLEVEVDSMVEAGDIIEIEIGAREI